MNASVTIFSGFPGFSTSPSSSVSGFLKNIAICESRILKSPATRDGSTVNAVSTRFRRRNCSAFSTNVSNRNVYRSTNGLNSSGRRSSHERRSTRTPRASGSMKIIPQRETVAGEATARSSHSNCMQMDGESLMISPETRHSFLLSSSTVFMLSIQIASTGPSQLIHFLALSPFATELHASRTMVEMMPSVHSFVSWLNSP
mmetsp:Transcript_41518/g.94534  ORF Transcript_41518/g.94534 Transcript_41518/m.94534 type:complete len:201 (+) Transcript_41518:75-677(+)